MRQICSVTYAHFGNTPATATALRALRRRRIAEILSQRMKPLVSIERYQPYALAAYRILFPQCFLEYLAPVVDGTHWHNHAHW